MEADCLEAETKGLREELWCVITEECLETKTRVFGGMIIRTLEAAVLALVLVMAAVIPLSVDPDAKPETSAAPFESLALLTSVESDIINELRRNLSSANSGRVVLTVEIPEKSSVPVVQRGAAMASEAVVSVPPPVQENKTADNPESRHPSADEVISLIQIGQRVLRVPDSMIRIIP
jgi:hypothetical protein